MIFSRYQFCACANHTISTKIKTRDMQKESVTRGFAFIRIFKHRKLNEMSKLSFTLNEKSVYVINPTHNLVFSICILFIFRACFIALMCNFYSWWFFACIRGIKLPFNRENITWCSNLILLYLNRILRKMKHYFRICCLACKLLLRVRAKIISPVKKLTCIVWTRYIKTGFWWKTSDWII